VLYTNPYVYVDFFAVPNEWGVAVGHQNINIETIQADVGDLSIYNIIVGQGQTCLTPKQLWENYQHPVTHAPLATYSKCYLYECGLRF
jgi:hypothetical protein